MVGSKQELNTVGKVNTIDVRSFVNGKILCYAILISYHVSTAYNDVMC